MDSGFPDESRGVWIKDKIAKETLNGWCDEINEGIPSVNKVSVNHQQDKHVAGVMVKGTARVDNIGLDEKGDAAYGLYCDTLIDKTKDNFSDTSYRLEKGLLDSYSIEFRTKDLMTHEYMPGAVTESSFGEGIMRTILPGTLLRGCTLASQPMNEGCLMIKEIKNHIQKFTDKKENKEGHNKMAEEDKDKKKSEDDKKKLEDDKKKSKEKDEDEDKPSKPKEGKEVEKLTDEMKEKIKKYDVIEKKEQRDSLKEELKTELKEDLKEELESKEIESKVQISKDADIESKEFTEFKKVCIECKAKVEKTGQVVFDQSVDKQWKAAGDIVSLKENSLFWKGLETKSVSVHKREYKNFGTNGSLLECKGLGLTTNQNSDTDYLLSAAELSDVFDPVIYNALNQKTTTWNLLAKDDYSNKGNNQVQFTLKTAANTTATAYKGNAVQTGNVTRLKYQTKFKKYQVGVEVDGDMIAAARGGPIGDVFAQEVRDSTDDLMAVMNLALYAEKGLETDAEVIGFEKICDYAGNTTLYNLTRSTANWLRPTSNTDTYINGASADLTKANLRKAARQAIEEGADLNNLVFCVSPIQYDKIKEIYDDAGRVIAPMSSRFGFEGKMSFEEVPVFFDKDCNDDDVFLVDLETHRVAVWVPPTLEMLGKDSDSQKGFVKAYWCTYNRAPRRMVMIYGNKIT